MSLIFCLYKRFLGALFDIIAVEWSFFSFFRDIKAARHFYDLLFNNGFDFIIFSCVILSCQEYQIKGQRKSGRSTKLALLTSKHF